MKKSGIYAIMVVVVVIIALAYVYYRYSIEERPLIIYSDRWKNLF